MWGVRGLEAFHCGGLKAAQQLTDWLIHTGHAGNGDWAGDDPYLIRGVTRILGLPQVVLAPPAQQVGVEDGHERHRLGVLAAQVHKPGRIRRGDPGVCGIRVGLFQTVNRALCVARGVEVGEDRRDLAGFLVREATLDALQQQLEAVDPGDVIPRPVNGGCGKGCEAACPLQV